MEYSGQTDSLLGYDYSATDGDVVHFDHWGDARSNNIDVVLEENRRLKPARLELFKLIVDFLERLKVPYFISDGTALAVYRDQGVMIPHDYDTDIGIMEEHFMVIEKNLDLLPNYVSVRDFDRHTNMHWLRDDGTEVPFEGVGSKTFVFKDTRDYSHLAVDGSQYKFTISVDVITWRSCDSGRTAVNYASPLLDWSKIMFPKEVIFPTREYLFEGMRVQGPRDLHKYLEVNYGYIGKDAEWDTDTQRYVKRTK